MSRIPKPKNPKGGWKQVSVYLPPRGSVQSVAAGGSHTVALKADGTVVCWGYNGYGQCNVPAGLGSVVSVAAGLHHTVALKADGSVACWGWNDFGQCNVTADLGAVQSVAAGGSHTVALKADGTVVCWGYNNYGQCNVPAGLGSVLSVAARGLHTVALKADGTVACWGYRKSIKHLPWDLSDEAWFSFVADYGDEVSVTKLFPARIRRTERYKNARLLMTMIKTAS